MAFAASTPSVLPSSFRQVKDFVALIASTICLAVEEKRAHQQPPNGQATKRRANH